MTDIRTPDERLADDLAWLRDKPLEYVMFAFPWDSDPSIQVIPLPEEYRKRFPGCEYGPDRWQCEFLDQFGAEIRKRNYNGRQSVDPIRFATASGHEIGKTTLVAWIIKFILDTRPLSKGSVTAMTDEQLRTKTWAELGKWHHLSPTEHWFEYSSARGAMTLSHKNKKYAGSWRCDARTCREEKSEAFAGQHAPTSTSFYIFDEASGIANKLFEVREGGLSSGEPMVFDFGNPTRNSGAFYENCRGRESARYIVRSIDSRSVALTNKSKIAEDAELWGEDSDRFRVRWRGVFPEVGHAQFMPSDQVRAAMDRPLESEEVLHQLVLGVDVARFGDDLSVIFPRRGRDARSYEPLAFSQINNWELADHVIRCFNHYASLQLRPAAIFVDVGGGYGGGVVDILNQRGYPAISVQPGAGASNKLVYRYKSDELWGRLREALPQLYLPAHNTSIGAILHDELTQREYGYVKNSQLVHLEPKRTMKERGLRSPDYADALSMTYFMETPSLPYAGAPIANAMSRNVIETIHDYDPLENI